MGRSRATVLRTERHHVQRRIAEMGTPTTREGREELDGARAVLAEIDAELAARKAAVAAEPAQAPAPKLRDAGQIYVTASAGDAYAQFAGIRPEEGRRRLTALLLDAGMRAPEEPGRPAEYRYRSGVRGIEVDITARVAAQDGLLVVVAVHCRAYRG